MLACKLTTLNDQVATRETDDESWIKQQYLDKINDKIKTKYFLLSYKSKLNYLMDLWSDVIDVNEKLWHNGNNKSNFNDINSCRIKRRIK